MDTKTYDQRYRGKYLCFTLDETLEAAKATFRRRFKIEPEEHFVEMGLLWLGPIPGPITPGQALARTPGQAPGPEGI